MNERLEIITICVYLMLDHDDEPEAEEEEEDGNKWFCNPFVADLTSTYHVWLG